MLIIHLNLFIVNMKDIIIKVKLSRLPSEEIYMINMLNSLTVSIDNNIVYYKNNYDVVIFRYHINGLFFYAKVDPIWLFFESIYTNDNDYSIIQDKIKNIAERYLDIKISYCDYASLLIEL